MITIGLVGGVASGKSAVACDFQKLGAGVLDGDRIGHEVLNLENVREQLVQRWGDQVLNEGVLDRSAVAELVFTDASSDANLDFLESITHPEIERIMVERVAKMRKLSRFPVCIIDAAVMIKAGWDKLCDHVIFVDSPLELRQKRANLRGLSAEQFQAREARQTPVEDKRARADSVIDNSGPPQKTYMQVEDVFHAILSTNQDPQIRVNP